MSIQFVIYFSLLFFLSEVILMMAKRSGKAGSKIRKDKKSLAIFWITLPLSISAGFFAAKYQKWDNFNQTIAFIGLFIATIGIIIRWVSIVQLNKEFTIDVAINKTHQLKTDGIYKTLRHPSYLGLLIIVFGLSIAMNSIVSLFVVTIPVFIAISYRIKVEENILIQEFGQSYKEYMAKSSGMIPKIY